MPHAQDTPAQQQPLPLNGMRVLDIATFLAAPFSATLLSEFGAEVIKIEHPKDGDPLRRFGAITEAGHSLNWTSESRNKKTITLNLGTPEGAALLKALVKASDVLVENFRPGTLEKWGLGYDTLRQINPALVMLRLSAYGQTGPYRNKPGFARIAHAFSGLSLLAGEPGRVPVTPGASTMADYASGVWGAFAIAMALLSRVRSGRGQCIDLALYQATFRYLDDLVPAYAKTGHVRERMGAETHNLIPHGHFATSDERWIALTCSSDKMFTRFAEMIGRSDLSEGRFANVAARLAERPFINGVVSEWVTARTADEVLAAAEEFGVPCGLLYSVEDIFNDPHYAAHGDLLKVDDPVNGEMTVPAPFPKFSEMTPVVRHLGRPLGADNDEVFREVLGLSAQEIERLKAAGVV
jgi:crotonobetainyl-CoA:carnitine CoA-transferase CaiB-like acyl-CoA transferase